jgi:hypothetical protein
VSAFQYVIVLSAQYVPAKQASSNNAPVLPKRALLIKAIRFRASGLCISMPFPVA